MPAEIEISDVRTWRRHLHQQPELAFEERGAASFINDRLLEFGFEEIHGGIAATGVVGVLHRGRGPAIALRADMDALPLQELNQFAHRSRHEGCMHACGHDGHTAMLLGAARALARDRTFEGSVYFIFQPAEERGGGGQAMLQEGLLERFPIEEVYGLHNWPALPLGVIALRSGPAMAACDFFEISIRGRGGHAAMPQQAIDPILAGAELCLSLQRIVSRLDPLQSAVLSVTKLRAGEAYNIIPEEMFLAGTVRTLNAETRTHIEAEIRRCAEGVCSAHGASVDINYIHGYPATINHRVATEHCRRAAEAAVGKDALILDPPPSMGSEDFSYFLQQRPGCYIWLGTGGGPNTPGLHSPHYDFNDEALEIGIRYWLQLVHTRLGRP
ncbi:MAG: amidohydrolase [Leptospirales bacterium]|nr:amidohydrolase [Leptospirales bacterium]